jgi:NAD(P) transhydrogenase subunit alpha
VLPATAEKLVAAGLVVRVEAGLGDSLYIPDGDYTGAGAEVVDDRFGALGVADLVLRLGKPPTKECGALKPGSIHISHLDPFREPALLELLATAGVSAISMEMIPRTTLAQKMDALSSQASLAGYEAVIVAAGRLRKVLPMMSTPAGTIAPARVFVIGAGVAGLQAIATANRLGALVEAFDTRPVVEEQVKSLGARFLQIDLGETGQTKDGYAKTLTPEQLEIQRQAMAKSCAQSDIVITTAQVFGRDAPRIVTGAMIDGMKPGSVVVDLAVETGGNVEGSEIDREVERNGVTIVGVGNMPGRVARDASRMYANNLFNFIEHFWDEEANRLVVNREDELMDGALITHDGEVVNQQLRAALNKET